MGIERERERQAGNGSLGQERRPFTYVIELDCSGQELYSTRQPLVKYVALNCVSVKRFPKYQIFSKSGGPRGSSHVIFHFKNLTGIKNRIRCLSSWTDVVP